MATTTPSNRCDQSTENDMSSKQQSARVQQQTAHRLLDLLFHGILGIPVRAAMAPEPNNGGQGSRALLEKEKNNSSRMSCSTDINTLRLMREIVKDAVNYT